MTCRTMLHDSISAPASPTCYSGWKEKPLRCTEHPKTCRFAWFITHTATTHIFVHAHVLFLDKTVHTSSSTLHSYCSKIIGHFEWRKMARGREQVTLEAGFTISLVAEIHLRCIRRTTVPWPYEVRLGSMTCQNDRSENSYPSVTNFVCFGIISEAENGLQN